MLFKNPVRTSKRTPHFTVTKINWLMLFKEIIAVYFENHTKNIKSLCEQDKELLNVTAGDTHTGTMGLYSVITQSVKNILVGNCDVAVKNKKENIQSFTFRCVILSDSGNSVTFTDKNSHCPDKRKYSSPHFKSGTAQNGCT
jgi:hypothetical protein